MAFLTQRRAAAWLLAVWFAVAVGEAAPAANQRALTEAQAKAGFLYNCAMFVSWPPSAGAGEIVIAVIGEDPAAAVLGDLDGREVNGRQLRVKRLRPTDDLTGVHIAFVAGEDSRVAAGVLERLASQPVLTVGGHNDFTKRGGAVRLYTDQDRLRFEINMTRVELAGLKVSAKMLGLARIVR